MTKEQYKQRRDELEAQIKQLEAEYIAACPYKVGDKVSVKHYGKEKEAFISHIGVKGYSESEYYELDFRAVKRDGTISLQGAGMYCAKLSDIIRKLS